MGQDNAGRYVAEPEARGDAGTASATQTASGTGTAFNVAGAKKLDATLTISARSGTTPTLDVALETTVDGTNWYTVAAFPQKNATGSDARAFGTLGKQCRWKWTITGTTPSFTFAITAKAHR